MHHAGMQRNASTQTVVVEPGGLHDSSGRSGRTNLSARSTAATASTSATTPNHASASGRPPQRKVIALTAPTHAANATNPPAPIVAERRQSSLPTAVSPEVAPMTISPATASTVTAATIRDELP